MGREIFLPKIPPQKERENIGELIEEIVIDALKEGPKSTKELYNTCKARVVREFHENTFRYHLKKLEERGIIKVIGYMGRQRIFTYSKDSNRGIILKKSKKVSEKDLEILNKLKKTKVEFFLEFLYWLIEYREDALFNKEIQKNTIEILKEWLMKLNIVKQPENYFLQFLKAILKRIIKNFHLEKENIPFREFVHNIMDIVEITLKSFSNADYQEKLSKFRNFGERISYIIGCFLINLSLLTGKKEYIDKLLDTYLQLSKTIDKSGVLVGITDAFWDYIEEIKKKGSLREFIVSKTLNVIDSKDNEVSEKAFSLLKVFAI